MFKGGSYWLPPPVNRYTRGSPDSAYLKAKEELLLPTSTSADHATSAAASTSARIVHQLSSEKRKQLVRLLAELRTDRPSIAAAMVFCIDNASRAEHVVACIKESLCGRSAGSETSSANTLGAKLAHLYLVSDILRNCGSARVARAHAYRQHLQLQLGDMLRHLSVTYAAIEGLMKRDAFRQRVLSALRAWTECAMYPADVLAKMRSTFLEGDILAATQAKSAMMRNEASVAAGHGDDSDEDVDGKPMESSSDGEDVDGVPRTFEFSYY